ncbi:hypothetical protein GCM10010123_43040 [Pilimelia anulata]|uniref:Ketoreductase domain-containing protein n=1 Tax=Pilimelia anulata TaxID=53371 RepID=A0A8J3BER5_9ACTN|nr:SDR family oxidoreductase [Pilimelia anulata]GGK08492.1 hypothetical protein GCM10010123_43040 [Pilimelia anulata]
MTTSLITGATGGIGAAIAADLAARGDRLLLCGRDPDRLRAALAALPPGGAAGAGGGHPGREGDPSPGHGVLVADLGRPGGLAAQVAGVLPERLDVLVHCAGVVDLGGIGETDVAAWERALAVNLVGPAELTRLALPALRAAGGHVVLINSGAGLSAGPRWGAYAASKFGLRALADALRAEEPGLRVTSVYPGRTATAMQESVHAQEGRAYDPARWIRPGAVAAAVRTALDLPAGSHLTEVTVRPAAG